MSHRLFIPFQPAATDRDFASLPPVSLNCPCQGQESGIQMMSRGRRREQDTDSHRPHWFQYRHHTLSPYTAKYILSTNRSRTRRLKCKLHPRGVVTLRGHIHGSDYSVLGLEIILVRGLVKFVPAVAYHSSLNLPVTFSQPRTSNNFGPST